MRLALRATIASLMVALSMTAATVAAAAPGGLKTPCEVTLVDLGVADGTSTGSGVCNASLPDGVAPDKTEHIAGQCDILVTASGRVHVKC